ncbi:hypothetical protein BJ875DRAFT_358732, partial [Amylocarpus encephaloides]
VVIVDKTISRQHLTVKVEASPTAPSRSQVTLTDRETKIGTIVNGLQIRGQSHVLANDDNEVTMGRYKYRFFFTWVPICLSFSFSGKELKSEPLIPLFETFNPLDIEILTDYERANTTHVVAKKRNTSKGLLALIDGKYIVNHEPFLKAIVDVATPNEQGEAPLVQDFGLFPEALEYLPPRGDEPTQRDNSAYAPDSLRQNMFDGYTFIFYNKRQFENLLAPITAGKGKALFREVEANRTSVQDFLHYVKGVAGEKGLGEFEDGSEGRGVVVVKWNPTKGSDSECEWFAQFNIDVALSLDHRLIEQREFLDAILGNDASVLRRPLEPDLSDNLPSSMSDSTHKQTAQISQQESTPAPTQQTPTEPTRRGRSRRTAVPRFKGFDDDDFETPTNLNSIPEAESMVVDPSRVVESQSLFVSQQEPDTHMDHMREASEPPRTQTRTGRKRQATPIDEDEAMDTLAPNAARLKRQRLEAAAARRERGEETPAPPTPQPPPKEKSPSPKRRKKTIKEINLEEALQARREEAGDASKIEREAQGNPVDVDVDEVRKRIEIIRLPVGRPDLVIRPVAQADESERWDNRWNGRRNFKKFRRRGADPERLYDRVIVSLEVVKKKDFGIGDEYWGEDIREVGPDSQRNNRSKKKGKAKARDNEDEMEKDKETERETQPEIVSGPETPAQPTRK